MDLEMLVDRGQSIHMKKRNKAKEKEELHDQPVTHSVNVKPFRKSAWTATSCATTLCNSNKLAPYATEVRLCTWVEAVIGKGEGAAKAEEFYEAE